MNPPDDQNLLRESEEKYRALVETTGTAYVINISDYTVQLASKNLGTNLPLGITCHALTNQRDKPCDSSDHPCPIEKVKQSGKDVVLVHTHYDAHGNARLVELHASPVVDSQGKIVQVIESTLDITERRRVEEAFKTSEERFRTAAESITDVVYEWDLKDKLDWFGDIDGLMGYPAGGFPRTIDGWAAAIHTEDQDRVKGAIEGQLKRAVPYAVEYRVRDKDGEWRWWSARGTALIDERGEPYKWIGAITDVTERKRAEEVLRNQNEEMEATLEELQQSRDALQLKNFVFDASIAANSIADTNGVITEVNAAFLKAWGYPSREEVVGRPIPDFLQNQDEVAAILAALSTTGEWEGDYTAKRKDGTTFTAHSLATVIRDEGGKVIGYQSAVLDISERRRLEDQLRVKDWVIKSASNAFAISDLAGNLNYVNPAFLKLWGFRTREEILGKPATDFWQLGEKAAEVIEGLRTRGGWSGEMVAKSKEGALFDVQVVASMVLDDVGRPFCMSASFVDITERKRAEGALQESEQRFKAIFNHSNDGILLADVETKRFFIGNETICQMLGCSPDEIKDLGVMDIHPPEELPYVIDQFEKQARKEIAVAKDLPLKKKDGGIFYADVSAFPITLAGKPYLVGAFRDTSERKLAEELLREQKEELEAANEDLRISEEDLATQLEELQQSRDALRGSEQRFRSLVETTSDWIWEVDQKGFYTYASPKIKEFLGYKPEEVIGRTPFDFMSPEEARGVAEKLREVMESHKAFVGMENQNRHKDGRLVVLETSGVPVFAGDGQFRGYRGIDRDITERRNLEAQLIQAQKMEAVGLLAGGIAHEFNNILGGILGYASLMRLKMEPDHPFWKYVETIEKSSQRAAVLTSQLLGFARKGKYDLRLLNLNLLAEDTLAIIRQTFDRAVTVEARLAESLPKVEGDTMQLQQVLMNLCINARDAMPQGGSLVLTTGTEQVAEGDERIPPESKAGLYVLLSVADTGCGMDEETQAKIFEPFFTTKEKGKGTGLGLAMVYGVVKNHGGFVTVQSEVGRGSVFTLHLPAAEKPSERRPEALAGPEKSRGAVPDQTILVVDDEESIRSLARDILEGEGYRVLLAEDGPQALEAYREHQREIGLVVLDIIMPKLGGGEVFLKLKEMDPGVHVLVSSGYSQEGKAQEILAGGAMGFVQKPFHVRDLISQVRQGLDGGEIH